MPMDEFTHLLSEDELRAFLAHEEQGGAFTVLMRHIEAAATIAISPCASLAEAMETAAVAQALGSEGCLIEIIPSVTPQEAF